MHMQRGDEVLVEDEWYPVLGYALTVLPSGERMGEVFTSKPRGKFEPCLGYRIDYTEIEGHRRVPEQEGKSDA